MVGLMLENGPIHVLEDGSIVENPWSWDKLVDYVFIDQPVYVTGWHP
jgi:carboxypeptidase D